MPTLNELRSRIDTTFQLRKSMVRSPEEHLVCDDRGQLSPQQLVESKVQRALLEMDLDSHCDIELSIATSPVKQRLPRAS